MLAFLLLAVLPRATMPVLDGDAWWHIHAGEEIVASGLVSDRNTWTIAAHGARWVSQDWLSNVLMAAIFGLGDWGITWLSMLFGLMAAVSFGLLWHASLLRGGAHWALLLPLYGMGLIVAGPIIGVRVQTVDLLLAALTVGALWGYLRDRAVGWLMILPLISLAWANLHAGWPLLFLLVGGLMVGEAIDRMLGRHQADGPPMSWRQLGLLGIATGVAAGALAINPNGWQLYAYPVDAMSITALRDFLVEWAPPDVTRFEGQMTYAFVALVVLPVVAIGWRRMRTADLLWMAGLTIMALTSVRFALFLGPIGAALAASALGMRYPNMQLGASPAGSNDSRSARWLGVSMVTVALILGVSLAVLRASPHTQAEQIAQIMPARAADWVSANEPDARIFNTYSWGGYLGWRLPDAAVYIDGRADIYGDARLRAYAAVLNVWANPAHLLDGERINIVLLKHDAPLLKWLRNSRNWEPAYEDDVASAWRRLTR